MKIETARFVRSAHAREEFAHDGLPQIAFVGRSNVGKSSLLNRLLGRKRLARISSTPGRTRSVNYFLINSRFYFVDLPGYGYARAAKEQRRDWATLMDSYFQQARSRAHVVQLVDAKVGATALDLQAFDYLRSKGLLPLVVATKADRVSKGKRKTILQEIQASLSPEQPLKVLAFSARTGEGVKEIWRDIDDFVGSKP